LFSFLISDRSVFRVVFRGSNVLGSIGYKLGELVPYFECFDLVSWFEIWVNGESYLRGVKSVRTAAVSAQSNFGR
jgi:hypothetical protein